MRGTLVDEELGPQPEGTSTDEAATLNVTGRHAVARIRLSSSGDDLRTSTASWKGKTRRHATGVLFEPLLAWNSKILEGNVCVRKHINV